jgi:predicted NBD/HSP70 family sugar kinase
MAVPTTTDHRYGSRRRLLEALAARPGCTRSELCTALGLSRSLVTALTTEFEDAGIISQVPQPDGLHRGKGRPPQRIALVRGAAFAVGVHLGRDRVRAAVCDLLGGIVCERVVPVEAGQRVAVGGQLAAAVLDEADVDPQRMLGVGVGLPLEIEPGNLVPSELEHELESRLDLPALIDGEATTAALGEHRFGAGQGIEDMLFVHLSDEFGLGLVLGGRIYRGASGFAGAIGHFPVNPHGLICRCGSRGCLETVAGPEAIAAQFVLRDGRPIPAARVLDLVEAGDRGAARVVTDAGESIGSAIAAAINILNPELVIIGGELARAGEVLIAPIRAAIERSAVAPCADVVEVTRSSLGERAAVLGAAALQLAHAPQVLATVS